jgi:hypothetical protein
MTGIKRIPHLVQSLLLSSSLIFLISLSSSFIPSVHAQIPKTVCFPSGSTINSNTAELCIVGSSDNETLFLTIHSSVAGWVAVGTSEGGMENGDVVAGWLDSKKGLKVESMKTTDEFEVALNGKGKLWS